jgi:uncharacterized membrane protein YdcZ (DUF606 family)
MVRGAAIAVIAGGAIAVQVRLLGRVSADAGPHIVGLLVSAASLVAALGVIAIAGLGAASHRAGTVVAVAGSIAGQLVIGAVLDRL